jgi:hypothetical protein
MKAVIALACSNVALDGPPFWTGSSSSSSSALPLPNGASVREAVPDAIIRNQAIMSGDVTASHWLKQARPSVVD